MKYALGLWLGLAGVMIVTMVVAGASVAPAPSKADVIVRVLADHKRWTLYRDRADRVTDPARPRVGTTTSERSVTTTLEFMRVGQRLIGHEENDELHHTECEFEVEVSDQAVTFVGCTGSDKPLTYDPNDRDYPFKGRSDGMLLWLAPSR